MAGSSSLDMAVAVSSAGGLGSLACAPLNATDLQRLLNAARSETNKPLNANFFAHAVAEDDVERETAWLEGLATYYDELGVEAPKSLSNVAVRPFDTTRCEVVEEFAPQVVSFHFGLPAPALVARIKAAGCKIICSATIVKEALWLEARGCDAIIAQGIEAGGHRGMFLEREIASQLGTVSLVPQIADAVSVPVIAAGGIADSRGIAAAFALGASGVQIGTAYLSTREATVRPGYRNCLEKADAHTVLTNVISGRPTRILANRLTRELGPMSPHAPSFPRGFPAMGPLSEAAERSGSQDFSAYYSGQSAPLARRTTAFELTRDLAVESIKRMTPGST